MKSEGALPSIFLDTSALFAGIWSSSGGGRLLLKLGEVGAVYLLVNSQVLAEIEGAIRRKAPERIGVLALLLDRSRVEVVDPPGSQTIEKVSQYLDYPPDAMILASAIDANSDYFVTLDRRHFLENEKLRRAVSIEVGTLGDCLEYYRHTIVGH